MESKMPILLIKSFLELSGLKKPSCFGNNNVFSAGFKRSGDGALMFTQNLKKLCTLYRWREVCLQLFNFRPQKLKLHAFDTLITIINTRASREVWATFTEMISFRPRQFNMAVSSNEPGIRQYNILGVVFRKKNRRLISHSLLKTILVRGSSHPILIFL